MRHTPEKSSRKVGGNRGILRERKEIKRAEAEARQVTRNKRTNKQQISLLKKRPGNSAKELQRLGA